jgi:hypothetical protein
MYIYIYIYYNCYVCVKALDAASVNPSERLYDKMIGLTYADAC